MTDKFWSAHSVRNGEEPKKKSRGEEAREAQLASAKKDLAPAVEAEEDRGVGTTGIMDARRRVSAATRALKRQQQYAKGEYPSGS